MTTFKKINEFVLEFLENIGSDQEVINAWEDREDEFRKLIKSKISKNKKNKDKDKPKRNLNSYIMFCKEKRPDFKLNYPNKNAKEITKLLAVEWKRVKKEDVEDYERYKNLAARDKERYKKEMEIYDLNATTNVRSSSSSDENEETSKNSSKNTSKNTSKNSSKNSSKTKKPKKGRNSYNMFCLENRKKIKEKHPNKDSKEITKILSSEWKKIKSNDEEYEKYKKLAELDKERYNKEMKEFENDSSDEEGFWKDDENSSSEEKEEEEEEEEEGEEEEEEEEEEEIKPKKKTRTRRRR